MLYRHLTLNQRYQIAYLFSGGISGKSIAEQIGCHPSTVTRELKRNRTDKQLALGISLLLTGPCIAADHPPTGIDALTASPANFKLLLENEHVRVLEYVLLPREQDKWHTHPPKVSYVLSGGTLEIHLGDGTSFLANEKSGTADWAEIRGKHYVKNVGSTPVRILLVEDKAAAREAALLPSPLTK